MKNEVLAYIHQSGPVSRAQLAKHLGFSKSTVSVEVERLLKAGLIEELGEAPTSSGSGRPATLLGFCAKAACAVGLDIGGTKVFAAVTDLNGHILYQKKIPSTNRIEELEMLVRDCAKAAGFPLSKVAGLGVGVPGAVDAEGTVLRCRVLQWSNYPLKKLLQERFSFPIEVGNDVNMIALGEQWLGAGRGCRDLLYLAFGTSVGGAVICNGKLVLGNTYRAGEVGYQLGRWDVERGHVNRLGEEGVFESKTSGTALSRHGKPSEALFAAYSQGKAEAVPIIREFILETAVVIANGLSFLNSEKVVLGGGVADSMEGILPEIRELVESLTPIRTELCRSSLGGAAGALGAVSFVLQQTEFSPSF